MNIIRSFLQELLKTLENFLSVKTTNPSCVLTQREAGLPVDKSIQQKKDL